MKKFSTYFLLILLCVLSVDALTSCVASSTDMQSSSRQSVYDRVMKAGKYLRNIIA